MYPSDTELSPEDQPVLDGLEAELESLDFEGATREPQEREQRQAALHEQIELLDRKTRVYSEADYLAAGAFLTISNFGKFRIERGMMSRGPKDDSTETEQDERDDEDEETDASVVAKPAKSAGLDDLSFSLIEDLIARKTAALRVALVNYPDVALVTVVHAMLLRVAYSYARKQSAVQVSVTPEYLKGSISDCDDYVPVVEFANMWVNLVTPFPVIRATFGTG